MEGDLGTPRLPVVRDVVPPQVELVADALLREQTGEALGGLQGAGGVLPLPLPADQQQAEPRAEPVEVLAVELADVVERVVEVGRVAPLAPAVPGRRVVVA